MPSAFDAAGAKLAASSICVFAVLALICVLYVLEVNARAEGVYSHEVDETPGLGDGENADVVEEVTIQDGEVKAVVVEGYPGGREKKKKKKKRGGGGEEANTLHCWSGMFPCIVLRTGGLTLWRLRCCLEAGRCRCLCRA